MDSEPEKHSSNLRNDKRRHSHPSGTSLPQTASKAQPDNKYYEVESILDGPRKRREHLFKYCYKVRWKGYGPEADTWQPIADLANVQDMIEDYKKERATKQREKGKMKPTEKNHGIGTQGKRSNKIQMSSSSDDDSDDDKLYDPIYGTVKDKFWKDLELGRHQNHEQLFSGDMYSKVKGCRRAAHAEAVSNIQRQQQLLTKPHLVSGQLPSTMPRSLSKFVLSGLHSTPKSSLRSSSKNAYLSARSKSPKLFPASRVRKRSSDPFSARGYTSAKRSRRSRESKGGNMSPVGKRSSSSSVSSETGGVVTASSPGTSPTESTNAEPLHAQTNIGSSSVSQSEPDVADLSRSSTSEGVTNSRTEVISDEDTDTFVEAKESSQDTVTLETLLTTSAEAINVDPETRPLDEEAQLGDSETIQLEKSSDGIDSTVIADVNCLVHSSCVNVGASGSDITAGPSYDASGATSGGAPAGPSVININETLSPKRSPLDAQSEASGAVERSHDEDCLWNGACNRSDCKSNRRRNMKNGQRRGIGVRNAGVESGGQNAGGENSEAENENQDTLTEDENHDTSGINIQQHNCEYREEAHSDICCHEESDVESKTASSREVKTFSSDSLQTNTSQSTLLCTASKEDSNSLPSSNSRHQVSTTSPCSMSVCKSSSKNISSPKAPSSSQSNSSGQMSRSLFSSYHADSSDSSFDESPSVGISLSRDAVSDSFCRTDPLARLHMDAVVGLSADREMGLDTAPMLRSSGGNTLRGVTEVRRSNLEVERPGLFSDNNSAFTFTRQDSGFSGGSGSTTPLEQHGQFLLPSSSGSINLCSPGKENFGSTSSKSSGLMAAAGNSRLQIPMVVEAQNTHSELSSQVQSQHSQARIFSEPSESRTRKRGSEISQPLEKIPSPNSRDSELDKRISTLTCDELEDFVEQGEERCSQKEVTFVSNADLLQAVNLNKAEVVKHAIRQSRLTDHKLDFEQPDSMGLTLLMRAVQKGIVAIVEMLLEHGVNVNSQQTNGTTALMIAAEQNALCLVAMLLKYGANSNLYTIHTDKAETALMKAIKRQNQEVVSLMLRVGVNIAAPTCTSISALELAVERRNPHIERIVRFHCQRLDQAFQSRVLATLEGTAELLGPLFSMQCFPLRESNQFVIKFNSILHPVAPGEGFLLFIAHTKITDKGIRCRFHGGCPIGSVMLNGVTQSPLTKEVNFVTSCHPIIPGCNILIIHKLADYTSKAKLLVQAFRARLLPC